MPTYQADAWTALGDPTRKAIFDLLLDRPRAVVELAGELPVSRPAVSQHLRVLKSAGLVVDQPAGTRRIYRVDPDGLVGLRADLDRFWGKALAAYKAAVEQPGEGGQGSSSTSPATGSEAARAADRAPRRTQGDAGQPGAAKTAARKPAMRPGASRPAKQSEV